MEEQIESLAQSVKRLEKEIAAVRGDVETLKGKVADAEKERKEKGAKGEWDW